MLGSADPIAFIPTCDPARSRAFYEHTLGLHFVSEDAFALVFTLKGVTLRVANVSKVKGHQAARFTVFGWHVADVKTTVVELMARGVTFERFPGMPQDDLGVWHSPSGARIAWFKDPDGNILSVTQG